ncbi:hypothetical protein V6N12_046223 [Hibiscus sabdariffa]|uniref:Uncharacterized protein n=1 Tax=Hibiscus sabdariffa TaxID=183260 RepID=A0ABR1ZR62_9ROSI
MPPPEREDVVVLLVGILLSEAMIITLDISNLAKQKLPWFVDNFIPLCLPQVLIVYVIFFLWSRFPRNITLDVKTI